MYSQQPPSGAFNVEPDWVTSDPVTLRLQTSLCQAQVFHFSHQAKVQGLKALNNSAFWRLLKGQVYETEKKSRHTHWIGYLGASLYRSYQSSTPQGSFSFFFFNISGHWPTFGEGNGTPLQYSCLENPMDGGAWKAAVHGVAKSWTRLSDFTFPFHSLISWLLHSVMKLFSLAAQ